METETYTLPASWACPLINDDGTGKDDAEGKEIRDWLESHPELLPCLDCNNENEFGRNDANHLYGATMDFVFPVRHLKNRSAINLTKFPTAEQTRSWIGDRKPRY